VNLDTRLKPSRLRSITSLASGAGILALLFLALHLPFLPASLEDLDSINFALGIDHFDVAHHQPHPPGYPLFLLAARAAHTLVASHAKALSLVGVVAGSLAVFALVALFRRLDEERGSWPLAATVVAVTSPLYWFTAARPLSDMAGLAAALGVQALTLAAFTPGTAILAAGLAGLAVGIRSQVAWLTVPLLAVTIIRRSSRRQLVPTLGGAAAAFIGGGLIWGIPLVVLSGGLAPYWHALFDQGAEDLTGITMLWTARTPRALLSALYYAFVAPWAIWQLATGVLMLAAFGIALLYRQNRRVLTTLAVAFVPYLLFDLLFQETFTTRYALPLVVPVAYLAVRGLGALPDRQAVMLAISLAAFNLVIVGPTLWPYSRVEAPAFRMLGDMRATASRRQKPPLTPVLAMHRREALDLRRPIQWTGDAMPRVSGPLPTPPKHEWLELVKYWNSGGREPLWFVADPLRTDLALVDHRRPHGSYRWPLTFPVLVGGVRPSEMDWYVLDAPGWYLGEGWALTPETAGVATEDRRGPGIAPIEGWIRRRPDAAVMMIGGRNMTTGPARLRVSVDGRPIDERDLAPGFFLNMIDLPAGSLAGSGVYAGLAVSSDRDRVAVEQFDTQSAGRVVFGFGDGWHEPEYNPSSGLQWRWTSERASLRVRPEGHALRLFLRGTTERYNPSIVTVRVGDRVLTREEVGMDFGLSIGIPADIVIGREATITIETDQTHVPAERSRRSPDRRRLGLRVYECRITPVS
jgi:hypothetical protein